MATDVAEKDLLQENIEEYVNDENKIVTCKWLSLTHSININTAKRALHTFVDSQRNKSNNDDLNVTYFVAGLGKSKDGELMHKCAVAPENQLEAVRKSLSAVTSCHIFSVQKAKLKDYTPLYMTDYEIIKNNLDKCSSLSRIKSPWAALRTLAQASAKNTPNIKPEPKVNPTPANNVTHKEQTSKTTQKKNERKGSIATMFASAGKKDGGGDTSAKASQKAAPTTKAKPAEKKGGMMAFVSKKTDNLPVKKEAAEPAKEAPKMDTRSSPKNKKTESKRKSKQRDDSDDEGPDKKRRRRIRNDLFDSSDEDEENGESEHEEPEEEKMEEQEEESPITISPEVEDTEVHKEEGDKGEDIQEREKDKSSSIASSGGKKRKRTKKQVTRHYQDEDGFMVTKKETVWESETDDEADEAEAEVVKQSPPAAAAAPASKPASRNTAPKTETKGKTASKKTKASPQKGKQTSMLSFFKKK